MPQVLGYAAQNATTPLAPYRFERRSPEPDDVQLEILFSGVCHSDLHQARDEWGGSIFPMVPGHEIVGRVTAVGRDVKKFKEGDIAAVGVMVNSCRTCANCQQGLENYCESGMVGTYSSKDYTRGGEVTQGGYSKSIVTTADFVHRVPANLDLAAVAPLLCAGITTYSPLREWEAGPGKKVGIVALGGLGHMGLKFAHAFGAHTVLFTTSPGKTEDAKRLGADEVVVSKHADEMKRHANSFDLILDTVSAPHDLNAYLGLLKLDGTLALVGLPPKEIPVSPFSMITNRRRFAGSMIGGLAETQEMLDFCGEHNIVCDIEKIRMDQVNEAYERMIKNDVKYRFVIDMASLRDQ